jgi:hypothetical protein
MTARGLTDVPLPANSHVRTDWEEWSSDGQSRIIAGTERRLNGLEICTCALQLRTGSISLSDPPAVTIDDGPELGSAEARQVAAMLLEAADEIDGWVGRRHDGRLRAVADLLASAHTDLLGAAANSADPDRFYEAASQLLAARARIDDAMEALR